jgi:hypothetical protein
VPGINARETPFCKAAVKNWAAVGVDTFYPPGYHFNRIVGKKVTLSPCHSQVKKDRAFFRAGGLFYNHYKIKVLKM